MNGSEYKPSIPGCAALSCPSEKVRNVAGTSFIVISCSDGMARLLWSDSELAYMSLSTTLKYDWSPQ